MGPALESEFCHSVLWACTVIPLSDTAVLCSNCVQSRNRWMQSNASIPPACPGPPLPPTRAGWAPRGARGDRHPPLGHLGAALLVASPRSETWFERTSYKGQWRSLTFPSAQRHHFKRGDEREPHLPTPLPKATSPRVQLLLYSLGKRDA